MIGTDLPNYIKYNPKIFAQTHSTTGLVLETFDCNISLALGNNISNIQSNTFLLKADNNSFKIQYEYSNIKHDIITYSYDTYTNITNTILNGNLIANHLYLKDYQTPSIILNDDINQIAGIGYNKIDNEIKYKTTIDGKHKFIANAGSLEIDLASIYYSNSVQQFVIHGDNIPIINDSNPSLKVQGTANIDGNLNVNGTITGTFPTNIVKLNTNNKIDATLLPQLAPDFRVLKTGKNIGIGTKNPLTKLHLYNGDLLVQNGWIGVNLNSNLNEGYPPKHPLHINFETNTIPALVLSSNNVYNFIAYADHPAIGIGTDKIDSKNISLYASGDVQCSNIVCSGIEIHKNNEAVLYYEKFNELNTPALVSKYPVVIDDKLFASIISSSSSSKNINFSNSDVYIDKDLYVGNNSFNELINKIYGGQYIGFGLSNIAPLFKLQVQSSNANDIAGFGTTSDKGALIYIYTSNDINKNYIIGIDSNNNFIINDNINHDTNGIKYKSDKLFVDNIITSNLSVLLTTNFNGLNTSNGLTDYNYIFNKPFEYKQILNKYSYISSSNFTFNNPTEESAIDVKGKMKLYNDATIYPIQIECDYNTISFLTNNGNIYRYVNTNITYPLLQYPSGVDFNSSNYVNKINFYNNNQSYISTTNNVYLNYNGIYSSNIIFNNTLNNILDIDFDNNTVYYINNITNNVYFAGNIVNINDNILNFNSNYSPLIDNNSIKFTKISVCHGGRRGY